MSARIIPIWAEGIGLRAISARIRSPVSFPLVLNDAVIGLGSRPGRDRGLRTTAITQRPYGPEILILALMRTDGVELFPQLRVQTVMLSINHISTSTRCEICHQPDQFDPVREVCLRCAGLEVVPRAPLSRPAPLPSFLAASLIPLPVRPKVKITLQDVIHLALTLILALVLNGGALLVACVFNEPVPETNYKHLNECWLVSHPQPKTVEEHLVESFDGLPKVLLLSLWFGVANSLVWLLFRVQASACRSSDG